MASCDEDGKTGTTKANGQDWMDVTSLIETCASSLALADPFLCTKSFQLHDAMSATQLMDKKMDSCEIPASLVILDGMEIPPDDKVTFPRPIPLGLRDSFTPLPWDELTLKDAAVISLHIMVRLQALLSGSSVEESTFTCLYAHCAVLIDMKARLLPDSIENRLGDLLKEKTKTEKAQFVVFAATLALVHFTDSFRESILNADIYEEEDFVSTTSSITVFTEKVLDAATRIILEMEDAKGSEEQRVVLNVLKFQRCMLSICSKTEMEQFVCPILFSSTSLNRLQRTLDRISLQDVNILNRSLIVLNLYFNERLLGKFSLAEWTVDNIRQSTHVSESLVSNEHVIAFVNRLAKPVYDTLKLRLLNRNRQRAYIEAVMLQDWVVLQNEAQVLDAHYRRENGVDPSTQPRLSQYVLTILIQLMDRFIASGVDQGIFYGHQDLSFAFWYRDFLLSALTKNLSSMQSSRRAAQVISKQTNVKEQQGNNKKRTKKALKNEYLDSSPKACPTPDDLENEFALSIISCKRMLCRGIQRFFVSLRQAGFLSEPVYEFTSAKAVFEKRFEMFASIRQPPPLSYNDYLEGSNYTHVPQEELLQSTAEWFQSCNTAIESLLEEERGLNKMYTPMRADEIQSLRKVCLGNSIYVMKLRQLIANPPSHPPKVIFDFDTHSEFCTIKLI
ncbi:predicted protein [Phaeodactylum tricornutum CCAP 1055/1]|uniref:Uncharacterized protein n=2 Tax=Phaeodactylum tricornutum TaxID=2850 RepID=B7GAH0_PHATC|nr:predicted protein [Phaeodactylum tricornutum CCAP 1055/1]EEC44374.1 predicted protein [Phaeodactylum tricornutum CCAP 1055/1]|eukprot:XP_002184196.1 predicted protein [Phaeodactylum tricornutum CCAP 1055/1]